MSAHCDQLSAYIDGQLDDAETEAFAHHLATCESCEAAAHDALQLVALETAARLKRP
ncbi:MAG: zf-HC2 domain-containing protein, partial [Myxococcales bacterium]|nr:zf-HC2 domain-containing protein [Myxococcales bacterium]